MSVAVAVFLLLVLFWPLGLSFALADSAVLLKDVPNGGGGGGGRVESKQAEPCLLLLHFAF